MAVDLFETARTVDLQLRISCNAKATSHTLRQSTMLVQWLAVHALLAHKRPGHVLSCVQSQSCSLLAEQSPGHDLCACMQAGRAEPTGQPPKALPPH